MPTILRRRFLQAAAVTAAATALLPGRRAGATPFHLPLGLQLYSVRKQLEADYPGTLGELHSLGFREVEAAGFFNRSPTEVKAAMQTAELRCVSAHYPSAQLSKNLDAILDFHKQLGTAKFIICAYPGFAPGTEAAKLPPGKQARSFSLEDWKFNAQQFNEWGKKVKAAGFQFGYHNHTMEFAPQNGVIPYELLLKETDPELVAMELDCGWVTVGGGEPEHYLRSYASRIKMLHVKDFARGAGHNSIDNQPAAAELGRGTANYQASVAAVKPGSLQHIFVEQEAYPDLPWKEALKVDADYLQTLKS